VKITIPTTTGATLKKKIFDAVEDETLKTWEVRTDTKKIQFLTHKPEQWYDRTLLRFTVKKDALIIDSTKWKSKEADEAANGYFIGRFTEILLVHFSDDFNDFTVSK
jgi:hypothetical protein